MKAIILFILGLLLPVASVLADETESIKVWNIAEVKPSIPVGYSLYVGKRTVPFLDTEMTFLEDATGLEGKVWVTPLVLTIEAYENWIGENAIFLNKYTNARGVEFKKYITTVGSYPDVKFIMFVAFKDGRLISISSHGWWFTEKGAEDGVFTPFFLKVIVDGFDWSSSSSFRGLGG